MANNRNYVIYRKTDDTEWARLASTKLTYFTDGLVEPYKVYKAILWGVRNGITSGYKESDGPELAGKFGTGLNCLREHIATFVCRYDALK